MLYIFSLSLSLSLSLRLSLYIYISTPSIQTVCDTCSIFKQSLTGLNKEFSFSYTGDHTMVKEPKRPYSLPIAGERIVGFITLPRV